AALVAIIPPLVTGANWSTWVYQGLAVLVVGCPCALVISTPISIVSAIGNAAKKGVLVKGGVYLEEMASLKAIAFDKTGTLTKGAPVVTDFALLNPQLDQRQLFAIVAALENRSQHPLASAIVAKAEDEQLPYHDYMVENVTALTGKGITGIVNGKTYYVGSPKLFQERLPTQDITLFAQNIQSLQQQGKTAMLVGTETELLAIVAVADEVRQSSKEVIRKLHEAGIAKTVMLTGDNKRTAHAIGQAIGVADIQAELMP
ncbi:HAD-IC family P-type ATPase, partial [Bacillus subtilis]